jgi:hypothetical protein
MSTTITKDITNHRFEVTAEEVAQLFWSLTSDEQASFFNELARLSEGSLPMQLEYVRQDEWLLPEGRRVMQIIGEYGGRA